MATKIHQAKEPGKEFDALRPPELGIPALNVPTDPWDIKPAEWQNKSVKPSQSVEPNLTQTTPIEKPKTTPIASEDDVGKISIGQNNIGKNNIGQNDIGKNCPGEEPDPPKAAPAKDANADLGKNNIGQNSTSPKKMSFFFPLSLDWETYMTQLGSEVFGVFLCMTQQAWGYNYETEAWNKGTCVTSPAKLATAIKSSRRTVMKYMDVLLDKKYIEPKGQVGRDGTLYLVKPHLKAKHKEQINELKKETDIGKNNIGQNDIGQNCTSTWAEFAYVHRQKLPRLYKGIDPRFLELSLSQKAVSFLEKLTEKTGEKIVRVLIELFKKYPTEGNEFSFVLEYLDNGKMPSGEDIKDVVIVLERYYPQLRDEGRKLKTKVQAKADEEAKAQREVEAKLREAELEKVEALVLERFQNRYSDPTERQAKIIEFTKDKSLYGFPKHVVEQLAAKEWDRVTDA